MRELYDRDRSDGCTRLLKMFERREVGWTDTGKRWRLLSG